jgi:hypothetical protein
MCFYIVDFCICCYKGDIITVIAYRLLKFLKPLYDMRKCGSQKPVILCTYQIKQI